MFPSLPAICRLMKICSMQIMYPTVLTICPTLKDMLFQCFANVVCLQQPHMTSFTITCRDGINQACLTKWFFICSPMFIIQDSLGLVLQTRSLIAIVEMLCNLLLDL